MENIALSFLIGLRYDFSAIFFVNSAFYIFHFLPFKFVENKVYQSITTQIAILVNVFAMSLNIVDTGYFSFQNGRSGADLIETILFSEDTANLLPQYIRDYWYHFLTLIVIFVFSERYFPRYKSMECKPFRFSFIICSLIAIVYSAVSFFIYRGFGVKPLNVVDAMRFTEAKYVPITLNTPFTVIRTTGKIGIPIRTYFSEEEAKEVYSAYKKYGFKDKDFTNKNVVIFILEGFSQRSVGALHTTEKGYTPFLDSIINHGVAFVNAYANGTKSIQAVPAILSSIPQLTDATIIGSKYAANKVDALPILLRDEGYKTAFFHGAFNGSMGFDKYCEAIGFDNYYGMNEFLEVNSMDGNYDSDWGIFDDKFLEYAKEQLDDFRQPFFSTIFTISSHHPYVVPEEYSGMFNEKKVELNALRYADFSLQKFFESASRSSWYKNTLFVFVADHTVPYSFDTDVTTEFISPVDRHRIPIVFYNPSDSNFCMRNPHVVQQIDILPSILFQLRYYKPFVAFGKNVFDEKLKDFATYYNAGTYTFIDSLSVIDFDGDNISRCFKIEEDSVIDTVATDSQLQYIKAFLQDYSHRMVLNKTSCKE
ncbi:MAG: LTA synthase family protein [Bacteroidales bacterium]|nr:LTA synthase family protein [Bacteroidales bacterium]